MPIKIDDLNRPLRELRWFENHTHVPSWERPGRSSDGHAEMRVTTHAELPWLMFDAAEYGDHSSRRTMITLSAEDGLRFYEWLKSVYEPALVGFVCAEGGECFSCDAPREKETKR